MLDAVEGRLFGVQRYPTIEEKAAAIAFQIVRSHVFVDGNKRTAFETLAATLEMNGRALVASDDEIVDCFEALGGGDKSFDEFVAWVSDQSAQVGQVDLERIERPRDEEDEVGG